MTTVNICDIDTLMSTRHMQSYAEVLGQEFIDNERKFWTPLLEKQPDIDLSSKYLTQVNPEIKWAFYKLSPDDIKNLGGQDETILGFTTTTPENEVVIIIYMTDGIPKHVLHDTIRHELAHGEQFWTGRLRYKDNHTFIFDDKEYPIVALDFLNAKSTGEYMAKTLAYLNQPWETEAFYESGLDILFHPKLAQAMWAHYDARGTWLPELPSDFWYTLEKGDYGSKFAHAAAIISSMM